MSKIGIFNVAVAVLIEKDDKILITKRGPNRDHAPNKWEAGITGRVDQGETCEQAVLRETKEELNIEIELIAPFTTFHFYRGQEKIEHLGVSFWSKYKDGKIKLNKTEQVEYKWVTPQESLNYITDPNVIKEVKLFLEFKKHYK